MCSFPKPLIPLVTFPFHPHHDQLGKATPVFEVRFSRKLWGLHSKAALKNNSGKPK